eukprot:10559704-Karenia_brevis.AAC.1
MAKILKRELSVFVTHCSPNGKPQSVSLADVLVVAESFRGPNDVEPRVLFAALMTALGRYHRWHATQNFSVCKVISGELVA